MATNFGKLEFSTSFNPTAAFPLDARSYFESYNDALAAASTAKEAGSTESVYYYGQTLVVVEGDMATSYVIQPDGTLAAGGISFHSDQFTIKDGVLSLKGFSEATQGSFLRAGKKDAENVVEWVEAFTKEEAEARFEALDNKISNMGHLSRKIMASLSDAKTFIEENPEEAEQYIYLIGVPPTSEPDSVIETDSVDYYEEYIVVKVADTKVLEKVGTWKINLTDYVKKSAFDAQMEEITAALEETVTQDILNGYVTKAEAENINKNLFDTVSSDFQIVNTEEDSLELQLAEGKSLLTSDQSAEIDKISSFENAIESMTSLLKIRDKLENSVDIRQVSDEFNVTAQKALSINKISMDKITNLNSTLSSIQSTVDNMNNQIGNLIGLQEEVGGLSTRVTNIENNLIWKNLDETDTVF